MYLRMESQKTFHKETTHGMCNYVNFPPTRCLTHTLQLQLHPIHSLSKPALSIKFKTSVLNILFGLSVWNVCISKLICLPCHVNESIERERARRVGRTACESGWDTCSTEGKKPSNTNQQKSCYASCKPHNLLYWHSRRRFRTLDDDKGWDSFVSPKTLMRR